MWTFRLERYQHGQRLPPIAVEMRGYPFSGYIADGHTVEVQPPWSWSEGQVLRVNRVFNRTLGTDVSAKRDLSLIIPGVIILIIVIIVIASSA